MSKSKARKLAEFLRNLTDDSKIGTSAVEQDKIVTTREDLESKSNDTETLVTAASVTSYVGDKLEDYIQETHDINLTFTGDVTGSGTITDMSHTSIGLTLDAETLPDQAGYAGKFLTTNGTAASWATVDTSNGDTAFSWGNHGAQGYATQTYVNNAVSNLVDSAPTTLDTLNELANALGDDPNFATTTANAIGSKIAYRTDPSNSGENAYLLSMGRHVDGGYQFIQSHGSQVLKLNPLGNNVEVGSQITASNTNGHRFGRITLRDDSIENHQTGHIAINYYGTDGGTADFKNLYVYDGKGGLISSFIGDNKDFRHNGDILIGTTDADHGHTDGDDGVRLTPDGVGMFTRNSSYATLYVNKLNNSGSWMDFHKNGSKMGVIGVTSNTQDIYFTAPQAGSGIYLNGNGILPATGTGATNNNSIDLGQSGVRWRDLYLGRNANIDGDISLAGSLNVTGDSTFGNQLNARSLRINTTYKGNFGGATFSWGGSATYPTLYGGTADRWVMICFPHVPFLQNGSRGHTGGNYGSKIRFEGGVNSQQQYDIGVFHGHEGKFGIGVANSAPAISVHSDSNVYISGTLTEESSLRFKENVSTITGALDKVNSLRGVYYNRIDSPENDEIGLIAEEVHDVIPELTSTSDDQVDGVKYSKTVALLVEAIKELTARVEELENGKD